ncbi:2TM domain-containing protein [Epilithonimonas sp. UC225_85]|uniref:2TM domain-containing protein n=1 Tax=Epilithonimonas sp. UC225_85 TaxID=3350167 RepID=UPI0036D34C3F
MENNKEKFHYEMAAERVRKIKKFYTGMTIFSLVFVLVYGNRLLKGEFSLWYDFNGFAIFAIWGLILAFKGFKLFLFNPEWEKDMINKELKKQSNGNYR